MEAKGGSEGRYRVLLIGIDDYPTAALSGCVNDIDAVQGLLIRRLGVPPEHIVRLASPLADTSHATEVPEKPATLDNIRAALEALSTDEVKESDKVFIYYSGHGSSAAVRARGLVTMREALVPADLQDGGFGQPRLLFDYELNALLARILGRTSQVALTLDCCHALGILRDTPAANEKGRWLDLKAAERAAVVDVADGEGPEDAPPGLGAVSKCQFVAACRNDQLSRESTGADGSRHGIFTRALMAALGDIPDAELPALRWARIWQRTREAVIDQNRSQTPWFVGRMARAVFCGPPADGDAGLTLRRVEQGNAYEIDAGTLLGVGVGARVAVYRDAPPLFPPLGSEADLAARLSPVPLVVERAGRITAYAKAEGEPFDVGPGARGRVIAAGAAERLRCAIIPPEEDVVASIRASSLLEIVEPAQAEARLEKRDGAWVLTDDVHDMDDAGELRVPPDPYGPVLVRVAGTWEGRFRAVLEHYFLYARPLRMAQQCLDLLNVLDLTVRLVPVKDNPPVTARTVAFPEAPRNDRGHYLIQAGALLTFQIQNRHDRALQVTLLNLGSSGRVTLLDTQTIQPTETARFWSQRTEGRAIKFLEPQKIDRLVAVGVTLAARDGSAPTEGARRDLSVLEVRETFVQAANRRRDEPVDTPPPVEAWTAAEAVIRTHG